jgi:hypothetical protein
MPKMQEANSSLTPPRIDTLNQDEPVGSRDTSEMACNALQQLWEEMDLKSLRDSAELYEKIYRDDAELQELTEAAVVGWPD